MPLLKGTWNKESVNLRVREITERTGCLKLSSSYRKMLKIQRIYSGRADTVRAAPNVCLSLFPVLRALCISVVY